MAKAPAAVKEPPAPVEEELEAEEEEELEEAPAPKAKKAKGPKRARHPFMSEEAFEEAVRVYEDEWVPLLDEELAAKMADISKFMRDTIGWKAWGRLIGTGNPKRD